MVLSCILTEIILEFLQYQIILFSQCQCFGFKFGNAGQTRHHPGPSGNTYTTTGWVAMTFCTNILDPQMINLDFGVPCFLTMYHHFLFFNEISFILLEGLL